MSWKKILALALLLAALVAAILWVERGSGRGGQSLEGTLVDLYPAAIEKIELRNPKGRFVISRRDPHWQLEEPLAARADKAVMESILDNFCPLKYDRLVTEKAVDLKDFGLDSPEIELRLFARGGSLPAATVFMGLENSMDGSSYAKLAAGGKVVSIAAYKRSDLERDLFAFRDKKFLEVDAASVSALDYRLDGKVLAFAKRDGQWYLEKPIYSLAQDAKVNDILSAASTLQALSFAAAPDAAARRGYGLEAPLLAAGFRSADAALQVAVGKQGGRFFAWVEGTGEICEIGKDFLDRFSADAALFREKKVARFYAFDVRELEFQSGPFRFAVRKDGAGAWSFARPQAGRRPDTEKIEALLSALAGLEAREFVDAPAAMPAAATRIVMKTEDPAGAQKPAAIIMEFGAAEGETAIARNPSLPYGFRVDKEILAKLPSRIEDIAANGQIQ